MDEPCGLKRRRRSAVGQRESKAALRTAKSCRAVSVAREVCISGRRVTKGVYRIEPEAWVALCAAVDEAWEAMKGVEE